MKIYFKNYLKKIITHRKYFNEITEKPQTLSILFQQRTNKFDQG